MKKILKNFYIQTIAHELNTSLKYFNDIIFIKSHPAEDSDKNANATRFFDHINNSAKVTRTIDQLKSQFRNFDKTNNRSALILDGNFNHDLDIQNTLSIIHDAISRHTRLMIIAYSPYFSWLFRWATKLGLRSGNAPSTFLTRTDLDNLCKISDYEVVRFRNTVYFPWKWFGLGSVVNKILSITPGLNRLSLVNVITLRPIKPSMDSPSVTVVIPARNEKGNIENALKRMPDLGAPLEVIFVEGNSNDGTYEEIQRVIADPQYQAKFKLKLFKQTTKGKADAVRVGFSHASHELITILDADLTMPPEKLPRFYNAYVAGKADFVNGSRLLYPMEGEAMRFLNHLGNVFFAKSLSTVLESSIGDSLCGTKFLTKVDYDRMIQWRRDFGDFDPFGDFELLFPTAVLGLGVVDIPIRYLARTYGSTNIRRFRDGLLLLKMTLVGLLRIRLR